MTENLLHVDTKTVVDAVQTSSSASFIHPISLLRSFMVGNVLVSGIGTTGRLFLSNMGDKYGIFFSVNSYLTEQNPRGCTCDTSDRCSVPAAFYNYTMVDQFQAFVYLNDAPDVLFAMDGWFVGCWGLGPLLISSFTDSFLYNQTTLDLIAGYFRWPSDSMLPTVLSRNESNRTNKGNRTFTDHLQNVFLIDLLTEIDYILYFGQCQPYTCTYLIKQHPSILYVFTLLLALYGGLTVVLRFLIPYVVSFLIQRLRNPNAARAFMGKFQAEFFRTSTVLL